MLSTTCAASNAKLAEQKSKPHQWKFLNTAHQTQSLAMTTTNVYPIQLVLLNGLVPFVWFLLRESTTSASLTKNKNCPHQLTIKSTRLLPINFLPLPALPYAPTNNQIYGLPANQFSPSPGTTLP